MIILNTFVLNKLKNIKMKYTRLLLLLFVFLSVSSCCSKKNNTDSSPSQEAKEINEELNINIEKKMLEAGYKKANVIYVDGKEAPCEYLIEVSENLLIEPMHELKSVYKIEKLPVWVKYHPQRRMSRCGNAQPVEIIGIEKR